ncbi:MAG: ROK family protein [Coriobacteriia bacterium]|jgi:glucokinase|nr:ROK family protein [Coriobacteriia bacterium]
MRRTSFAIGVDVGGTRIAAGLIERKGRVVKDVQVPTPQNGPFSVVDSIIDVIEQVSHGAHESDIAGIGIGLPAQIDFLKQSVEYCTNLPLAGVDVRALVLSRVHHEVTIDNDGNLAANGEYRFGAAKGARDFLMVTIGTGVGGGMFLNGEPYRGSRGMGGEVGHMVVQMDGPLCPCGGRGHLESYLSRPAIAARGREAATTFKGSGITREAGGSIDDITAETVIRASLKGDEAARAIMFEAGEVLGRALVSLVNLLNPRFIVIGGGIGESCAFMVERAAEVVNAEALAGRRDVSLVRAELGNDAGILGAAALAFDEHDVREGLHR